MLTGGCLCGAVRFEISGRIGPVVYCHCSMCRRSSGSAFAANASVKSASFRVLQGDEVIAEYRSSEDFFRAFCSRCGSPLYGRSPSAPQIRRIRLGALDSDPGVRCVGHVWVGSKAPWHEITDNIGQFPGMPPRTHLLPP